MNHGLEPLAIRTKLFSEVFLNTLSLSHFVFCLFLLCKDREINSPRSINTNEDQVQKREQTRALEYRASHNRRSPVLPFQSERH